MRLRPLRLKDELLHLRPPLRDLPSLWISPDSARTAWAHDERLAAERAHCNNGLCRLADAHLVTKDGPRRRRADQEVDARFLIIPKDPPIGPIECIQNVMAVFENDVQVPIKQRAIDADAALAQEVGGRLHRVDG